jgi:hypothetical protein
MPGQDVDTLGQRFFIGSLGIALQHRTSPHSQHLHPPPGAFGQRGNQIAVARVVAVPGQHCHLPGIRPPPTQCPPCCMGRALHQFKARRASGDQACVEVAHLRSAVQRVG